MKEQNKQKFGEIIKYYSKDKNTVKIGSAYFSWVNQLTLHRTQLYNAAKSATQYLQQQYPIEDPDSSQCHRHNNCETIFQAFKAGGCEVTFLPEQQIQKQKNQTDYQKLEQLQIIEGKNKQNFLDQYGIGEKIKDCYTVHYEDVGAEIVCIMIFRDDKFWYRLDTDRIWPGYQY